MAPRVSVLMPTYRQAAFIARAIDSLVAQSVREWELIIVDDDSPDATHPAVEPFLQDERISYHRLDHNVGLGAALNEGMNRARAPYIAYLPSDDVYHADHLGSLLAVLDSRRDVALAYSGVRHHYNRRANGQIDGYPLQLVQVAHRLGEDRWLRREELVTDDLDRMFWSKLRTRGSFAGTGTVTCEWVDHPDQHHKVIREPVGGINPYRVRYDVRQPMRFHSSVGNRIDEVEHYGRFRDRPDTPPAADGLKILLVGELAYNPERVLALEERGHRLYGLWMRAPYWYNTVGPVPFGHVQDLPYNDWQAAVRELQPDVIYALLNWQAVPFAHEVLTQTPNIPFVWHFKEGPFICLENGMWDQLIRLYMLAGGRVYCSPEMEEWVRTVAPGVEGRGPALVLDGDLPKREWLAGERSSRLSAIDGECHTVVPGRPIGLPAETVRELARTGIHLHVYGDYTVGQWHEWVAEAQSLAPHNLHVHAHVDQEDWVREFSRYDAGWLHAFRSRNGGDVRAADWDDLNYPARMSTLALAGLPLLQMDNAGSIVATQSLMRKLDAGVFFSYVEDLAEQLRDTQRMDELRSNMWRQRARFTFDYHADRLIGFFRQVIAETAG